MVLRPLIHDIWLAGIVLQVILVGILAFRKAWMRFPFFAAYASFSLFETGFTLAVAKNGMLYFYSYWICEAIATILGLAVVYEVFRGLFSSHAALRRIAELVFRGALVLLVLFGVGAAKTIITSSSWWRSGFESMLTGVAAAAVTYGAGRLFATR